MIEVPMISTTDMIETDKLEAPENFRASPPANGLLGSAFPLSVWIRARAINNRVKLGSKGNAREAFAYWARLCRD